MEMMSSAGSFIKSLLKIQVSASATGQKKSETAEVVYREGLIGKEIGGKNDEVGDRVAEGLKIEDTKDSGAENDKWSTKTKGSKWSGFEDEGENDEWSTNKEGSKWSEFEDKEENDKFEVKDEGVAGKKVAIHNYEDGWGENWDNGARRIEAHEEQQYFDNYKGESNGMENYNEEAHWHGNVDGDSVGLNDGNSGSYHYPLRSDPEDCSFYMRTGTCKFGSNCKFNHPLKRKNKTARDAFKQRGENSDRPGQMECKAARDTSKQREKNSDRSGQRGCQAARDTSKQREKNSERSGQRVCQAARDTSKQREKNSERSGQRGCQAAGDTSKQREKNSERSGQRGCQNYSTSVNHSRATPAVAPILEFNFLGLPIRVGEKECPYYMRTGSCKYESNCRFNHPNPTEEGEGDSASQGSIKNTISGSSSARTLDETAPAPFVPVTYPSSPTAHPNVKWNGYQVGRDEHKPSRNRTKNYKKPPNPTEEGEGDSASQGSIKNTISGSSSARTLDETAPAPFYPSSPTAHPNVKWNGYQVGRDEHKPSRNRTKSYKKPQNTAKNNTK